jgi:Kef-type K+ transport system membrane component KefB
LQKKKKKKFHFQIGLMFVVFEGGLKTDLHTLRKVGFKACLLVLIGSGMPILLGWALFRILGYDNDAGLASGVSLSSTAIGVTTKMLMTFNMLTSDLGVLLSAAALLDDVVSMVLLGILGTLKDDDSSSAVRRGFTVARPALVALGAGIVALLAARLLPAALLRVRTAKNEGARKIALMTLLIMSLVGFTSGCHYAGTSYIFGSFLGGLACSKVEGMDVLFDADLAGLKEWMSRLFFGSIGLAIPAKGLFSGA